MVNATQSSDEVRKTYIRNCKKCGAEVECKSWTGNVPCASCKPRCAVEGCNEPTRRRGMCDRHSQSVIVNPGLSSMDVPLHLSKYVCIVCGGEYTPKASNQKRCGNPSCAKKRNRIKWAAANARRTKPLTCVVCGSVFETINHGSKYCKNCVYIGISRGHNPEGSRLYEARVRLDGDAIIKELKRRSFVTEDGCWEWQGRANIHGYGSVSKVRGVSNEIATHRVALEAKLGHSLGKMQAHHVCANRICCNPDHLELATSAENQGEMRARLSYEARIRELEQIVRQLDPGNPAIVGQAGKRVA